VLAAPQVPLTPDSAKRPQKSVNEPLRATKTVSPACAGRRITGPSRSTTSKGAGYATGCPAAGSVIGGAAGAVTENEAGANPPVGRDAVIVKTPGVVGAVSCVVKPPFGDAWTGTDPVGPLTVMDALPGKYEPRTMIAAPGW